LIVAGGAGGSRRHRAHYTSLFDKRAFRRVINEIALEVGNIKAILHQSMAPKALEVDGVYMMKSVKGRAKPRFSAGCYSN
jgi:hypothetical protein